MGRYFVRFEQETDRDTAASFLAPTASEFDKPYRAKSDSHLLIAEPGPEEVRSARQANAKVYEDILFSEVAPGFVVTQRSGAWAFWEPTAQAAALAVAQAASQADVMRHIKAPEAWQITRGAGVTIAIVDTGIAGTLREFAPARRSPRSVAFSFSDPWVDERGHGSMCAGAAAASTSDGGRFDGVAPEAQVLSARTTLFSTDIYKIYDRLIDDKLGGQIGPLVISNSYGMYTCAAPTTLPRDHPYLEIVREAVRNNIVVVFAAGNNHFDVLCNHNPADCAPNTIWGVNSVDEVITVGTVDASNSNTSGPHANSSRGPGQWSRARRKPDVVAPTYGEVIWGGGYRVMDWWGTSGACPQVAGLAALMLAVKPSLTPSRIGTILRSTAVRLPAAKACVGAGLIDCEAAVKRAQSSR